MSRLLTAKAFFSSKRPSHKLGCDRRWTKNRQFFLVGLEQGARSIQWSITYPKWVYKCVTIKEIYFALIATTLPMNYSIIFNFCLDFREKRGIFIQFQRERETARDGFLETSGRGRGRERTSVRGRAKEREGKRESEWEREGERETERKEGNHSSYDGESIYLLYRIA